ncbi:MAG: DNA topoisomerase [Aigarchaeota archaeon]|nr:DNA topoisomerase [Aigarchaeota archaeon]MDW7986904.1 DNA topoisomerase [Nitrososphaerota archaeon]
MIVVVAEKPSVARAIDKVFKKNNVKAYVVGLRGHLLESDLKEGYEWGKVDPSRIFEVRDFRLKVRDRKAYLELLKVFRDNSVEELVIATDNDSEGELIGYEVTKIFREFNSYGKVKRMRFNAVSVEELWRAWENLEEGLNWRWIWKASYRRDFDLITGAAFTRLLTLSSRRKGFSGLISWGSCQIPTLNYIVEREEKIINFKPTTYWVISARFETELGEVFESRSSKIEDKESAEKMFNKIKDLREGVVEEYVEESEVVKRPKPLRTDEMLRDLHKITGAPASKILSIAERLYAEGFISYPRTDTNQWPKNLDFKKIALNALTGITSLDHLIHKTANPLNGNLNDGAHPPIYPVKPYPRDNTLKWKVWEYVSRRFLANVYWSDGEILKQKTSIKVGEQVLKANGSIIKEIGFYEIYPYFKPDVRSLPRLSNGQKLKVLEIRLLEESTKPPSRLTESELLKFMERDGIGTDATRAEYPKIIIERRYATRISRVIKPTRLGMSLITSLREVDPRLVSPQTRRIVEEYMEKIVRGEKKYEEALDETLKIYFSLYKQLERLIGDIAERLARSLGDV